MLSVTAAHPASLDISSLCAANLNKLKYVWISPLRETRLREISEKMPHVVFCNSLVAQRRGIVISDADEFLSDPDFWQIYQLKAMPPARLMRDD
jgi:hypothetical protein